MNVFSIKSLDRDEKTDGVRKRKINCKSNDRFESQTNLILYSMFSLLQLCFFTADVPSDL